MIRNKILAWAAIPIVLFGIFSFSSDDKYFEIARNLDIFASLYQELNKYYVDDINPNQLIRTGVDAMLKNLDPYTVYIPEDDIEDFRTNATGEYGGIGIQSNRIDSKHLILNLYEESPAFEQGLKIGDQLLSVDGHEVAAMSDDEVGKLLKGQSGSEVFIEVLRNSTDKLHFTLERSKITIPNISFKKMLTADIGYLRLSEFTNHAADDVKDAVKELKTQGAKKLIIDLRDNPGGLLNEAVGICNLFVPKGSKIVDTKGKIKAQSFSYTAKKEPLDLNIPIAVLINSSSASASEIVSGVIQDYDRGVIVGQKSYGKGLVQVSRSLPFNSQLKVTTAKYYTPSGRCIQVLDYSKRNADGSVGKMADSLRNIFYTGNNRIVLDGGGIDPDIAIEAIDPSTFTKNLSESGLLFDYATRYYYSHDSIVPAVEFRLTDEAYTDFKKWMTSKSFENNSRVEKTIDALIKASNEDKVYHEMAGEIEEVSNAVKQIKSNGLVNFEPEIRRLLEKGIILRYYLTSGTVEASLDKDHDVGAAIAVLNDPEKYHSILKR